MNTKIQKWGNSFAVRLPKKVIDQLELKAGSGVSIDIKQKEIFIRPEPEEKKTIRKNDWKQFVLPSNKKKENVTKTIDKIVYGQSSR